MSGPVVNAAQNCGSNFLNQVSQGIYSLQEKICGLCSTDCKIYTLLIVGRILQTAAVTASVVALGMTFVVGPAALFGCVVAGCAGLFGTYIAGNGREVVEKLKGESPFVPGQPVGLVNSGSNCWLNSGLQLLAQVPAFEQRMSQIPELNSFLPLYGAACSGSQKVAISIDTHRIRQALSHGTGGLITPDHVQQDAAQLFEYLFEGRNGLCTLDQQIDQGASTRHFEPMLSLDIEREATAPSMDSLLTHFFDHRTNLGQRSQRFLQTAPNDLLIQLKRFYRDPEGTTRKMDQPIELTERFQFPSRFVRSGEEVYYGCDAFINHLGSGLESGHYVAYIKKGDVWWYCSDSAVYEASKEEALRAMKQSYILHYKKV